MVRLMLVTGLPVGPLYKILSRYVMLVFVPHPPDCKGRMTFFKFSLTFAICQSSKVLPVSGIYVMPFPLY